MRCAAEWRATAVPTCRPPRRASDAPRHRRRDPQADEPERGANVLEQCRHGIRVGGETRRRPRQRPRLEPGAMGLDRAPGGGDDQRPDGDCHTQEDRERDRVLDLADRERVVRGDEEPVDEHRRENGCYRTHQRAADGRNREHERQHDEQHGGDRRVVAEGKQQRDQQGQPQQRHHPRRHHPLWTHRRSSRYHGDRR